MTKVESTNLGFAALFGALITGGGLLSGWDDPGNPHPVEAVLFGVITFLGVRFILENTKPIAPHDATPSDLLSRLETTEIYPGIYRVRDKQTGRIDIVPRPGP